MALTLTNATTLVRELLDEPVAQFWSNTEITNWLNEGCADAARRAEWKRTTFPIDIDSGTGTYTGPTDVYRIYRMEFVQDGSPDTYTLEFRGRMEMDQIWGINQQWPASYPLYYTTWNVPPTLSIQVYPVPSTNGTVTVFYYQQITPAVAGGDSIDILQGFEDMIVDYCVYRAWRKDGDPRWNESKDTYNEKMVGLIDTTRTFQDQAGTFTTGQAALPSWLVSDGLY